MKTGCLFLLLLLAAQALLAQYSKPAPIPLALPGKNYVQQIAQWLPEQPTGFGVPYQQREVWQNLLPAPAAKQAILTAEALLKDSFPAWSDAVFMDYFETGSREKSGKMFSDRGKWLPALTWAECIENKGRFVPAIEMVMQSYYGQTSWVLPPHDINKKNILKKGYLVDLAAADIAHNLAQAGYLLNNKLSPAVRAELQVQLQKRIFEPVLTSLRNNERKENWWLTTTNNWGAVCLSGVTGAALAAMPHKEDRAMFVAIAAIYAANAIAGFANDGYCSEGLGYYDYGFGRYIFLRENILQATKGNIDLFAGEKIRNIARYPLNIEMAPGVYPTIADCKVSTRPAANICWYNSRSLGLGIERYDTIRLPIRTTNLVEDIMYAFPNAASRAPLAKAASGKGSAMLRSYFSDAGILVVRPAKPGAGQLAACIKGGNNNEHHNHNDLGSYTLAIGNKKIVEDPGGPYVYTATTFGKERYTITCINSYGHPVPLAGGQQQAPGAASMAKILYNKFSDSVDVLSMDIASAYPLPGIKKLERKFVYDRSLAGTFTVADEFEFDSTRSFETAVITRANYTISPAGNIVFSTDNGILNAVIQTGGQPFTITKETITEEKPAFDRIAIRLTHPAMAGRITVIFTRE